MHLTIATSELGVSGTKKAVDLGPGFSGVGSSSRMRTVGLGLGSNWVRRFLEGKGGNGDEGALWWSSSSSERMIGSDILGLKRTLPASAFE